MSAKTDDDIKVKRYYIAVARRHLRAINQVRDEDVEEFGMLLNDALWHLMQGRHEHCRMCLGKAGDLIDEERPMKRL